MGNLDTFLAAVDGVTQAGLAMNTALGQAQAEMQALVAENAALKAEIGRLQPAPAPAPADGPLDYQFIPGIAEPPFLSYGEGGRYSRPDGSMVYVTRAGKYRRETGRKHATLEMIGPEPTGKTFEYEIDCEPGQNAATQDHKVIPFQFWSASEAPPPLSLEYVNGRMRLVLLVDGQRVQVIETAACRGTWKIAVMDGWLTRAELVGIRPVTFTSPKPLYYPSSGTYTFKFGNYFPSARTLLTVPVTETIIYRVSRKELS